MCKGVFDVSPKLGREGLAVSAARGAQRQRLHFGHHAASAAQPPNALYERVVAQVSHAWADGLRSLGIAHGERLRRAVSGERGSTETRAKREHTNAVARHAFRKDHDRATAAEHSGHIAHDTGSHSRPATCAVCEAYGKSVSVLRANSRVMLDGLRPSSPGHGPGADTLLPHARHRHPILGLKLAVLCLPFHVHTLRWWVLHFGFEAAV